jgi:hypothetical protein
MSRFALLKDAGPAEDIVEPIDRSNTVAMARCPVVAWVAPAIVLAAVAALYVGSTRTGVGLTPDSVSYVEGARSLAAGDGYSRFIDVNGREAIVDFPPLYSTALAGFEVLGIGTLAGARLLNGVLLVGTALLLYLLTLRLTGGHRAAAVLAAGAFGLSLAVLRVYGFALSEPLFLFLVAAWGLAMDAYLRRGGRAALIAVASLVPASILTRNVGVAVLLASVVAILAFGPGSRGRRVRDAAIVSTVGVLPALVWTARNRSADVESVYEPAVHAIPRSKLSEGIDALGSWVFPPPVPEVARSWLLAGVVAAGALAAIAVLVRRSRRTDRRRAGPGSTPGVVALVILAVVYAGALVFSLLFLAASGTLSTRYLAPLFLAVVVLAAVGIASSSGAGRIVGLAVLCALVVGYTVESVDSVSAEAISERGITADYFADSPLLDVATAQPGRVVYSDRPETIYINTGLRAVEHVPKKYDQHTLRVNPAFEDEVRHMGSDVRDGRAVIIMWNAEPREHLLTVPELRARVDGLDSFQDRTGTAFHAVGDDSASPVK